MRTGQLNRRQRLVLNLLASAPGEWVCSYRLIGKHVGGIRAAARVHELRHDKGYPITSRTCRCGGCKERKAGAAARRERYSPVAAYRLPEDFDTRTVTGEREAAA